MIILLFGSSVL